MGVSARGRFLGDLARERGQFDPPAQRSGKRVLVVGGARVDCRPPHLARLGHEVEIRDARCRRWIDPITVLGDRRSSRSG